MKNFLSDIERSLAALRNGDVIIYPTDTIWGLGCDATNAAAIDRIFNIKQRSASKSMIILVADETMIRQYVNNPSERLLKEMKDAETPTTGIFEEAKNLPSNLVNSDGSIAVRIASDDFCHELVNSFQKPIVSTSANISQHTSPQNFSEIDPVLINQANYTVFHRRDDVSKKNPSHIIRLNKYGDVERIR